MKPNHITLRLCVACHIRVPHTQVQYKCPALLKQHLIGVAFQLRLQQLAELQFVHDFI